jgi:hypothetical protein
LIGVRPSLGMILPISLVFSLETAWQVTTGYFVLGELIKKGCILLHSSKIILDWRSPKCGHDTSDYFQCVFSGNDKFFIFI